MMRLIVFGTGAFALPILEALRAHVCLVVTQPDRPSGRGMRPKPSSVKMRAMQLQLPVETPDRSRSPEFVALLRSYQPTALVVASYGQILSQAVLEVAPRGGINLHGSILPKYRGAAPIQRCILNGEGETGVTLMQMDRGMDTGDIIEIATTPIGPDETYTELQDRLAGLAATLAADWMPRIHSGDYPRLPQDHTLATVAPKIGKNEAELRFDLTARLEYNRFRAFTENPGAFVSTRFGLLRIHRARFSDLPGAPGQIIQTKPSLVAGFLENSIELLEVQLEGKNRMSGRDFANGARLRPGDSLTI